TTELQCEGFQQRVPAFVEGPVEDGEKQARAAFGVRRSAFGEGNGARLQQCSDVGIADPAPIVRQRRLLEVGGVDGTGNNGDLSGVYAASDEGFLVEPGGDPDPVEGVQALRGAFGEAVRLEHGAGDVEAGVRRWPQLPG